jgi:hypothetical protein
MLSFLYMSIAQAGFGLSMEARQTDRSGQGGADETALNSTLDYRSIYFSVKHLTLHVHLQGKMSLGHYRK